MNDRWTKTNSINPIERPNGEIKGCTDVSRILTALPFQSPPKPPSSASLGYIQLKQNDEREEASLGLEIDRIFCKL